MTLIIESARAPSVPGRIWSHISAFAANHVSCGSQTISLVPLFMSSTIQWPRNPSPFDFRALLPTMKM